MLYQAEPRPDKRERLFYLNFPPRRQFIQQSQRVVVGQIRLQRRHRHEAVLHRLVVGPVVRLPVVLPFLDPVVVLAARIDALVDDGDVVALAPGR